MKIGGGPRPTTQVGACPPPSAQSGGGPPLPNDGPNNLIARSDEQASAAHSQLHLAHQPSGIALYVDTGPHIPLDKLVELVKALQPPPALATRHLLEAITVAHPTAALWKDREELSNKTIFQGTLADVLSCLNDRAHMSGSAISRVMQLLNVSQPGLPLKCGLFLDTLAVIDVCNNNAPSCIARWKLNVPAAHLLFFPVHVDQNHWTLITVDVLRRSIEYFDSLAGDPPANTLGAVLRWLDRELPENLPWSTTVLRGTPQQNNLDDCGAYLLTSVELLARGLPAQFRGEHIVPARTRLAALLMNATSGVSPVQATPHVSQTAAASPLATKSRWSKPLRPRRVKQRRGARTHLTVATANIRTPSHLEPLFTAVIRPKDVDIVGVQEVKQWVGEVLEVVGYDYYGYHEVLEPTHDFDSNRHAGCGFFIKTDLRDRVVSLPSHSTANMGWIRLRSTRNDQRDRYICVFYGTCRSQGAEAADDGFHRLRSKIGFFQAKGEVIVLGDMNAHVGYTLGPNSLPTFDPSGEMLRSIVEDHNLVALNTQLFCRGTATRTESGSESVIDYILREKGAACAPGTIAPNCCVEDTFFGSDHRVVWTRMLDTSARNRATKSKWDVWEFRRLGCDVPWSEYADPLREEISLWSQWADSLTVPSAQATDDERAKFVNAVADSFSHSVILANEKHFTKTQVSVGCKPWWTPALEVLFEAKTCAYKALQCASADTGTNEQEQATLKEALRQTSRRLAHAIGEEKQAILTTHSEHVEGLFYDNMKNAKRPNHALYYRKIKQATGQQTHRSGVLLAADGTALTDKIEQAQRFGEFYEDLMSADPAPSDPIHAAAVHEEVEAVEAADHYIPELDGPITQEEMVSAQRTRLHNFKAGSPVDGLLPEMLKRHGPEPQDADEEHPFEFLTQALVRLFNIIYSLEVIPDAWKTAAICPIYKNKGPREECKNYRPISLLSVLGKMLDSIITTRLNDYLEEHDELSEHQWAFRKCRSAPDLIWTASEILERRREEGKKTFAAAVDIVKAYDCVWHDGLFVKLAQTGVKGKMWRVLRHWYQGTTSSVLVDGVQTAPFLTTRGVRQGACSSPDLYSTYIKDVVDALRDTGLGVWVEDVWVGILLYADDAILMANSEEELHAMMATMEKVAARWQYTLSHEKSSILVAGRGTSRYVPFAAFTFNKYPLTVEWVVRYLGVELATTGSWRQVCIRLRNAARTRFGMMAASGVHRRGYYAKTGARLYNAIVRPITDYGADVWIAPDALAASLEAVLNWAARTILGLHPQTPAVAALGELGWLPSRARWDELKLRRFHRFEAMNDEWLAKRIYIIRRQDWRDGRRRPNATPWCYEVADVAERVGFQNLWDDPVGVRRASTSDWRESVQAAVAVASQAEWRAGVAAKPTLHHYARIKSESSFESYLTLGTISQRHTMVRLRTGTLPLPATRHRWRDRSPEESVFAPLPLCDACGRPGPADEEHFLMVCPALDAERDELWRIIAAAVKCVPGVDYAAVLLSAVQTRTDLLFMKGSLPRGEGRPMPLEDCKEVQRAILTGVHSLWVAYKRASDAMDASAVTRRRLLSVPIDLPATEQGPASDFNNTLLALACPLACDC
jgi:hypothetical protein